MANSTANVATGKPKVGGAFYIAPAGTTLPSDATTALAADFICAGYISDAGLKNNNARETAEVKAWGGDTVLNPVTGHTDTFSTTFIEVLNPQVLKLVHGDDNVSGALATGITVNVNGSDLDHYVMAVDMILNGAVKRIVIPDGQVTAVGEVSYTDADAVGYETTITGYPDASGNTHYEYIKATT